MSTPASQRPYEAMFRPAIREGVFLVIGLAGASGSGKTMSAMRMAQGIVGRNEKFAVIDTETRRALHYAPPPGEEPDFVETFNFEHAELGPPFRPEAYERVIKAAATGYRTIVVDSFSHVHEGEGGVLDWSEEILRESVDRAMKRQHERRSEWELREAFRRSSWITPKMEHKRMVQRLLQVRAHLILCLRAEDKIDFVKGPDGKTKVVPMETLSGFKGWIPVCDKRLPFEMTASFILTPDQPGVPKPIKLQEQHRPFFPLDQPIGERSGHLIAEWARGSSGSHRTDPSPPEPVGAGATERPGEPDVSRRRAGLIASIKSLAPKVPATDRENAKRTYGITDPQAATLDALREYEGWLKTRAGEAA